MAQIHIGLTNGHFTVEGESPRGVWDQIQRGDTLQAAPIAGSQTRPKTATIFNPVQVAVINVSPGND
jgi:hypothetical protein